MFFINALKKILVVLQSDSSPNQIIFGAVLGIFFGIVPGLVMKTLIFIIIMLLNVNIGTALLSGSIFAFIGLFTDPLADKIGYYILNINFLKDFWTYLYNIPLIPFTKFNNTIVMGNIILSILFIIPVYFIAKKLIAYYRKNLKERVAKWKIVKMLTAGSLSYKIFK